MRIWEHLLRRDRISIGTLGVFGFTAWAYCKIYNIFTTSKRKIIIFKDYAEAMLCFCRTRYTNVGGSLWIECMLIGC